MNLPQLCEPVFQYVCRLNRLARKGGALDYTTVHSEISSLFVDAKATAETRPELAVQYEKVELPLMFFVDSMIVESNLSFASQWHENRLAYTRNELAGDEKFFEMLDEALGEAGEAANERLTIFYTCIGLGFTGWYAGRPDELRGKMKEIAARIKRFTDSNHEGQICPEAYGHLDTRDLVEPPSQKILGIAIALVGLLVVLFATNVFLYRQGSHELSRALRTIIGAQPDDTGQVQTKSDTPDEDRRSSP